MTISADFPGFSPLSKQLNEASAIDGGAMTLFNPVVEGVLARLYAEAEENDRQLKREEEAAIKASADGRSRRRNFGFHPEQDVHGSGTRGG